MVYRTPSLSYATRAASPASWIGLLRDRRVLGMCAARDALGDSAWYFFILSLPKYLADVRRLNIEQIGYFAWMPYACAGAGSFLGGWFSELSDPHGWSVALRGSCASESPPACCRQRC